MDREVLVDSSAWLAVADRRERMHAAAQATFAEQLESRTLLVTTDLILAEVHILLRRRLGHEAAVRFLDSANASPHIEIVFTTSDLEVRAKEWLRRFADQDFSLTDAVSFALMGDRGIGTAFALDAHFVIAGFTVVPALSP